MSKPVPEGYQNWNEYWTKEHNQPWRTEAEIDEKQAKYLEQRLAIPVDIEKDLYPFKNIELTRQDVEWLLANHVSGGISGPVYWEEPAHRRRRGLDLRGAILHGADLRRLPLAKLIGGLSALDFDAAKANSIPQEPKLAEAAINLEGAKLSDAQLQGSALVAARMSGVEMIRAQLEAADMFKAQFASPSQADLSGCIMNAATSLREAHLVDSKGIGPRLRRVQWNNAQLQSTDWEAVKMLADERDARSPIFKDDSHKIRKDRNWRILDYERAISANQLLATALRNQGLREVADKFAYRTQLCQRAIWRHQLKFLRYFGSLLLDLVSGYGYKPVRSFTIYLLFVVTFAVVYYLLGNNVHPSLDPLSALVFSVTSFHGRGFAPGENVMLNNPLTVIAAGEAIIGLLIEITFIATFTQRFFAR